MNYLSLLVPVAYLGILVSSLATFSSLYRKRKLSQSRGLAPYFPPHTARDLYLSLLHLADDGGASDQKVPDGVLRAALLQRAQEDITRIIEIRGRKQALQTLLARGVVGDEIWQRMVRAEQEMEAEVKDVVAEANAFSPNWGQTIFQSASEMAANAQLKKKLAAVQATVEDEKDWWAARKASVKEGFLRELDEDEEVKKGGAKKAVAAAVVIEKANSDGSDEAVLVDTPEQAPSAGADANVDSVGDGLRSGTGSVRGKKKKGKK